MSIDISHVSLSVPDGTETRTILHDVNLSIDAGEVVALGGASGSGKSTLVAIAALLQRPDAGTVTISGHDASDLNDRARTRLRRNLVGVVYQSANLLPSLTALEQVELIAHISGTLDREARARAHDLLSAVGLDHRMSARPSELSGGERQRVGIARALMNEPEVLLADEPTAALDAERGRAVMDLLTEQANRHGTATLVITHLIDQIEAARSFTIVDGTLR